MGGCDGSLPHATIQRTTRWRTQQLHFLAPNAIRFREGFPEIEDSNNPLAVELERENDPAREILFGEVWRTFLNFVSVEAARV